MNPTKNLLVALLTLLLSMTLALSTASADEARPAPKRSHIDLVIALDTSNSMDGLIDSARQKVWDLVNEMATAKPTPILRVGLISYGNDSYRESGWTRVDQALTDDLDAVYEKLMALKTNGGTEYVGRALHVARTQMKWDKNPKALKMIFVAGNESADQDLEHVALKEAGSLIAQDVLVNTIYCGDDSEPDAKSWREVALRADGKFANIARNGGAVVIATPYDDRLNELSGKLNQTYVAYGSRGAAKKEAQAAMDMEASGMSGSAGAARARAKSSKLYRNSGWDLVDALEEEDVDLDKIADDELPQEMRGMSKAERRAYVDKKKAERAAVQKEIAELSKKRDAYIKEEMSKRGEREKDAFDEAVSGAIRDQAKRKNIVFEE